MKSLKIADDFGLPLEAVTQTFCILAKRGVGKTYTASVLAEEMLKAGQQIVALDPTGAWWGLRSEYPVVIFGGEHADVPLEESAGEVVARALVDNGIPAVIDLSLFRKGQMIRFVTAFAEALYRLNRAAVHLFVDEADAFAPQGRTFGTQNKETSESRMLGAMEDIVRRGRKKGIGCTLITQRPAVLNKNVLTQAECLVALRLVHPKDIGAVMEWVNVQAEPDVAKAMVESLPGLPIGTAWFWSPGWGDFFQRVKVRKRETFDSGATPKAGEAAAKPKKMAAVDLTALGESIKKTAEEAKANDPAALKRQIAELKKQLAENPVAAAPKVERVEVPVVTTEQLAEVAVAVAALKTAADRAAETAGRLCGSLDAAVRSPAHKAAAAIRTTAKRVAIIPKTIPDTTAHHRDPSQKFTAGAEPSGDLTGTQQRMLDTIRMLDTRGITPDRDALARWQGLHPNGSRFGGDLARLREAGYLDGCALTDLGNRLARATPTGPDAALEAIPEGTTRTIVRTLADLDKPISREDLAAALGVHHNGSRFGSNLAWLRAMKLIPDRGPILLTEAFRR
jgi:hypothetical protein